MAHRSHALNVVRDWSLALAPGQGNRTTQVPERSCSHRRMELPAVTKAARSQKGSQSTSRRYATLRSGYPAAGSRVRGRHRPQHRRGLWSLPVWASSRHIRSWGDSGHARHIGGTAALDPARSRWAMTIPQMMVRSYSSSRNTRARPGRRTPDEDLPHGDLVPMQLRTLPW